MKRNKMIRLLFCLLVIVQLFPASPIFAETVQDVPVGEPTISSKAEDPLKEYKEKAQNQVSTAGTVESVVSQDVPGVEKEAETSPTKIKEDAGESPTPENGGGEEQEITNQRIEPRGGVVPLAGTTLVEGLPGDLNPYDIDKNFADAIRSIHPTAPNPMTDDFMESLNFQLNVSSKNLVSLKGIEYAKNLEVLRCDSNQLTSLDVSKNTELNTLECQNNQIAGLDISNNKKLVYLSCLNNGLMSLDVKENTLLETLRCASNSISSLDLQKNTELNTLDCSSNPLGNIDTSNNKKLTHLACYDCGLSSLELDHLENLVDLSCGNNSLTTLDIQKNTELYFFSCENNQLTSLDVSRHFKLESLYCNDNFFTELDVSRLTELLNLVCNNNLIKELDVTNNLKIELFLCNDNEIESLDVSRCTMLSVFNCSNNRIRDIRSTFGLSQLVYLNASDQQLTIPVPTVSLSNEASVDVLKTTAQTGLTVTNIDIIPPPTIILPNGINGDIIDLTGVTRESLNNKSISFEYDSNLLVEGASSSTNKFFSGIITFALVSELKNELQVSSNKSKSSEKLTWKWTITSLTEKIAEDIKSTFTLPNYQAGDISDIQITHQPSGTTQSGTINHLNGTDSLGDLDQGESIEITFKSVARGDPDAWYEAVGRLDWSDNTPSSPHNNESKQQFKILDEEQQDLPKDSDDMGILSAPVRFHFGRQTLLSSVATHQLNAQNYQTNTNVVTDGFYTRIKDDQAVSTGWKLTASLSEFKDSVGRPMPNGAGTSLRLENMFIQKVNDRDTPQEALDPSATGGPSTIQTDETLVAGQTAKTLVSAQVGEGQGTWQLQMPFDDISLTLPAGAGKSNTDYKAKLTWSLNNTP